MEIQNFEGLTGQAVAVIGDHLACFDDILAKASDHAKKIIIFGDSARHNAYHRPADEC